MKKRMLCMALCLGLTLSMTACGGSSDGKTKAKSENSDEKVHLKVALYSDGQNMSEAQKKVFDSFTEEHPDIVPEFQFITSDTGNWNGYLTKIKTMIASGEAPDVVCVGLEGVAMMAMQDLAIPIDDYVDENIDKYQPILDNIAQELQDIYIIDGKRYSIPYEANSVVTHIRKDIFEEKGVELPDEDWTFEEFKDICGKISDPDNGIYAFGVPTNFFCLASWLYANGGATLNEDWTEGTINSPEVVEVFQFFQDAIHKYHWAPQPEANTTDVDLIVQGKTAMGWWGRWVSNDYASSDLSHIYANTLPAMKNGHTTCAGSCGFVVMKSSKHQEEAKALACWTAEKDYVETFMKTGSLPANSEFGAEICSADPTIENWECMYKVYETGDWRRSQDPPEYADLGSIYQKYMDIIYSNQMTAQEALDLANDEINQLLQNSDYRKSDKDKAIIESLFKN